MSKKVRAIALAACAVLACSIAGCGGNGGPNNPSGRGKVPLTVWAVVNENNKTTWNKIVADFNAQSESYTVKLIPKTSGYSAQLGGTLKGSNPPNVVEIDDRYYKGYVNEGYLTDLEEYFVDKKDESGNVVRAASSLDLSDFWETAVTRYRYRYDKASQTGYSGAEEPLHAIPIGISPGVLYYNATALKAADINIISVDEKDLESYNQKNSASLLPHGYYEYDTAPMSGLTAKNGKYLVFNNRIPMNWDELVTVSKYFTRSYNASSPTTYGFFNEWWFSFGWSVGGDCLEWDSAKNQYVMALGEDTPNYLVTGTDAITVNGNSYRAGDLLSYEDKHYVIDHNTDATVKGYLDAKNLYPLPSIRDAFTLFLQLPQSTAKRVTDEDGGKNGYGVSPTPSIIGNKSKMNLLTSREVAFVCENYSEAYSIGRGMSGQGLEWDIAPLYQYREYNADGTLKEVNGTEVKGKMATHSNTTGFAIPSNAKSKDGAFEFIEYLAGPAAQALLMRANLNVPNQKSLAYGEEYMGLTENYFANNKLAILEAVESSSVGDWSYLENGEWVNVWANVLNTDVRNGDMKLEEFFANACITKTNDILKTMRAKKYHG